MRLLFSLILSFGMFSFSSGQTFSWPEGTWMQQDEKGTFTESWVKGIDGNWLGNGYYIMNGDTVFHETLNVQMKNNVWYYIAKPGNAEPTSFHLINRENETFAFQNLDHDFPSEIVYEFKPDNTLTITLTGLEKGKPKKEVFEMKKQ